MNACLEGLLKSAYGNVVFSRAKNAFALQTSLVFLFFFAHSCRKSYALHVFLHVLHIFM